MNLHYRTLLVFLILSMAVVPAFSQEINTKKAESKTQSVVKEEPREDGLRKISTRTPRDWDFDIHIDEEAMEANIERAVEQAMRDVEIAMEKLEKLEIYIEPIEINLEKMNLDMKPIEINIPDLNIDIAPIIIDLDIDIDMDEDFDHDEDWDSNIDTDEDDFLNKDKNKEKDKEKNKDKSKLKDKPEKTDKEKEKDKAKGLKKNN